MILSRHDLFNLEQCCFLDDPGCGAFAFFFGPTPKLLTDVFVPTPGNLPFSIVMPRICLGGGGGGMGTAGID